MATALALAHAATNLIASVAENTRQYFRSSKADSTLKRYQQAWDGFERWCALGGAAPLPATDGTVADYISALADGGRKWATIHLALAAIGKAHQVSGFVSPVRSPFVREVFEGITRRLGKAQKQAQAALKEDIWMMLASLPKDLRGVRDRAMLLIGFNAALRESELVALNLEDVAIYPDGRLVVTVRRSKTDQEGEGREIAIPSGRTDATCAAKALGMWLELANITSGAIFRNVDRHGRVLDRLTPQSVALVVKNRSKDAGLDAKPYSGHSLRAGFATSAALAGVTELAIARQTGHKSTAMIKRYVRVADMWRDNAAERVGL